MDYFGIDCSLLPDGRLLLFELNASMNTLKNVEPGTTRYDRTLEQIQAALVKLILERAAQERVEERAEAQAG